MTRVGTALVAFSAAATISMAVEGFAPPTSYAATRATSSVTQKVIVLNGKDASRPYAISAGGTTYMPIWYVMNVLNQLGIANRWTDGRWMLSAPVGTVPDISNLTPGSGSVAIYLDDTLVQRVNVLTAIDPASGAPTTFMPIWYVMQALKRLGLHSTWNGDVWTFAGTPAATASAHSRGTSSTVGSGIVPAGSTAMAGMPSATVGVPQSVSTALGTQMQNRASNDSVDWSRASRSLYLMAQTADPYTSSDGTYGSKLIDLQPGQPLYLSAYEEGASVSPSDAAWLVNSPDATVTANLAVKVTAPGMLDSQTETRAVATFVASAPGIYTVQAHVGGEYSQPLVITVGYGQLTGVTLSRPLSASGVLPLPGEIAASPIATGVGTGGTHYTVYPTQNGWLPFAGTTANGAKSVSVMFLDDDGNTIWSYRVPVASDGSFGGMVAVPQSGPVIAAFSTSYDQSLTELMNNPSYSFQPYMLTISNSFPSLSAARMDLLSSAKMDYNMSPEFARIASTFVENAPSIDTAIAAINNFVSDSITYNQTELNPGGYRFQDSLTTLQTGLGICEDYAELEASLLKSVGVRAETVQGVVGNNGTPSTNPLDGHEWVQAWNGQSWLVMDPTWSGDDQPDLSILLNEFDGATSALSESHFADSSAIGTSFARSNGAVAASHRWTAAVDD